MFDTINLDLIFDQIDKDNSKTIQMEELKEFIRENDVSYLDMDINTIMNELDKNGDGTITHEEFTSCFEKLITHK